ncbi:DUF6464 family protein [Anabaena subtropica]|uniref:Uncharacterized protein n=1 Tax=Anabaena subtropica FACHB-260 TaxID=2692884 RepID=A0ABR8CNC7_9NOST|nr:DUF6464 family protein [Anabaena subtropica]MBD2343305.1 hypothetical protein [Anabaena subtropica FACHB-260]
MLRTLLVIAIGFLPSMFSLWVIRKTQSRTHSRLRQAATNVYRVRLQQNIRSVESDARRSVGDHRYYLEGVGYLIGDISCKFNARSGYLRCAVNPSGPCQGCRYYEPTELVSGEAKQ